MVRETVLPGAAFRLDEESQKLWRASVPLAKRAVLAGWLDWPDLGVTRAAISQELHSHPNNHAIEFKAEYLLCNERAWSWVANRSCDVVRLNTMVLPQLQWLRAVDGLDLLDREKLIQQIAAVQTLSAHPPGNPAIHDWRDVRGLFFTPCYPALQDTYAALAALEILGGLDRIDSEACIEGILRVHRGKGFFDSPSSGSYNEYHIEGDAHDTIAAYESLRILGALDRVKDLDQWRFRTDRRHVPKSEVTWMDIEAWVAQQRLQKVLDERKTNPSVPYRSLLAP